jgi:hypothetical protein
MLQGHGRQRRATPQQHYVLDAFYRQTTRLSAKEKGPAVSRRKSFGFNYFQSYALAGTKAGELGFEPRLSDPESLVLPLHYSPSSMQVIAIT